jgi:hypothetical protein
LTKNELGYELGQVFFHKHIWSPWSAAKEEEEISFPDFKVCGGGYFLDCFQSARTECRINQGYLFAPSFEINYSSCGVTTKEFLFFWQDGGNQERN